MNERPQPYTFPNPFVHAQLGHFPLPIFLVLTIGLDHTPRPNPISSTHLQPPFKVSCPTYGHQFTSRGLTCHHHSCQISNSSNPNPCDHCSPIPSLIFIPSTSTWTWVSTLNVHSSFHSGLCCPCLYNCILIAL
jgi:hypothetical protein